ncbi:MarR family winged helix-turn-helix transcriptional regulator [Buchananella hordeovulneris]|uniref:HTH marR-type domain-containing protein n=1 Tax=Buchananella hordeovulneris TaxID=52770 RepID=A0A1Q5PVF6_9ACTO|nr:MarR family transcriptional regulator [Buchananella hordeovulneris]OKL51561.1 hypothetical protein BSZ40_06870 [Buchananella hordeovulneris]RRD44050.1 MarR family transcriptional regulator [Buchananella hordeovulneris]RRD53613.1 MarR family transcriptional regulator [Buchananella hordeovulneris]
MSKRISPAKLAAWGAYLEYSARIMVHLERGLKARSGLTMGEYNILLVLAQAAEPLRMGELGQKVVFAPSRLTYAVGVLEKRELVERCPDAGDRRVARVTLTAAGRAALRAAAGPHLEDIDTTVMSHLDEADAAHLHRIFTHLGQCLPDGATPPPK